MGRENAPRKQERSCRKKESSLKAGHGNADEGTLPCVTYERRSYQVSRNERSWENVLLAMFAGNDEAAECTELSGKESSQNGGITARRKG